MLVAPVLPPGGPPTVTAWPEPASRFLEPPRPATSVPCRARHVDEASPPFVREAVDDPHSSRWRIATRWCAVRHTRFGTSSVGPMHRADASPLGAARGGAKRAGCRPPAPRGWRSLARSSPTSRVPRRSRRHRRFGFIAERQLPAPCTDSRRCRPVDLRGPSPHLAPRVRRRRSMGGTRSVVSLPKSASTLLVKRRTRVQPHELRLPHPFATLHPRRNRLAAIHGLAFRRARDTSPSRGTLRR